MIKTSMFGSVKFVGKAGRRRANAHGMLKPTLVVQTLNAPIVTAHAETDPA